LKKYRAEKTLKRTKYPHVFSITTISMKDLISLTKPKIYLYVIRKL